MLNYVVFTTSLCILLLVATIKGLSKHLIKREHNANPQFLAFQHSYLLVYYYMMFGDWLNAPYLYKLYDHYGFLEEQIAILYVCGFASALVFGLLSGHFCKKIGSLKLFMISACIYALSSLIKLSSNYSFLIVDKILSGAATALMFSAQETWYLTEHIKTHDFPEEWIGETYVKTTQASGVLAVIAGAFAYLLTEIIGFGPVAPSILSVPILLLSCAFAMKLSSRQDSSQLLSNTSKLVLHSNSDIAMANVPRKKGTWNKAMNGLQGIFQNKVLFQIGIIQALYESVLCLFVFLWTPVLDHHKPPLGIVFSSFMAAILLGGSIYRIAGAKLPKAVFSPTSALIGTLATAGTACLACVLSTEPTKEFPVLSYIAFLLFELTAGVYFSATVDIKRAIKTDKPEFAATSWFRVPLNLLACSGLLLLHNSSNEYGARKLFACCFVTIVIALLVSFKFGTTYRENQKVNITTSDSTEYTT